MDSNSSGNDCHADFLAIASDIAAQITAAHKDPARVGKLISGNGSKGSGSIREPQLRHLWALEIEKAALGYYYEMERPTHFDDYAWKPGKGIRARVDFALHDPAPTASPVPRILLEFKDGAPDELEHDLVKLIREGTVAGVEGVAIMTMIQAGNPKKALARMQAKLPDLFRNAIVNGNVTDDQRDAARSLRLVWFEFLAVVRYGPESGLYRATSGGKGLTLSQLFDDPPLQLSRYRTAQAADQSGGLTS